IGGIAVTLIAPHLFKTYYEWELSTYFGYFASAAILFWAIFKLATATGPATVARTAMATLLAMLLLFAVIVGWIDLSANLGGSYSSTGVLARSRNFFGTL